MGTPSSIYLQVLKTLCAKFGAFVTSVTIRSFFCTKRPDYNTKLDKGDHYFIQTRHKDLFSHYNLILRKL